MELVPLQLLSKSTSSFVFIFSMASTGFEHYFMYSFLEFGVSRTNYYDKYVSQTLISSLIESSQSTFSIVTLLDTDRTQLTDITCVSVSSGDMQLSSSLDAHSSSLWTICYMKPLMGK